MASEIGAGPVPEFGGHGLDALHSGSRTWGLGSTLLVFATLFFGAGVLGRVPFTDRPFHGRTRTVTLHLAETAEPAPSPHGGEVHGGKQEPAPSSSHSQPPPIPDASKSMVSTASTPAGGEALPVGASGLPVPGEGLAGTSSESASGNGHGGQGAMPAGQAPGRGLGSGPGVHGTFDPAASYRASLASWLAARKRYPAAARNQGRQGEVLLALEMDASGALVQVRLERSSGHDLLDQAALALVKGCGSLPPPPAGLRQVRVAVDYSLA